LPPLGRVLRATSNKPSPLSDLEEFVRKRSRAEEDQNFVLPQFTPSPPDDLLREFVGKYGGVEETETFDKSNSQETQTSFNYVKKLHYHVFTYTTWELEGKMSTCGVS
jgi:hypothetical protein